MKAGRSIDEALADMLDAAEKAVDFCEAMTVVEFVADHKTAFAVIHALTIVGEAAKQIPVSLRERHPDVPFRIAAAMRDKLVHDYFGVRRERLWETVRSDLPPLIEALREVLAARRKA